MAQSHRTIAAPGLENQGQALSVAFHFREWISDAKALLTMPGNRSTAFLQHLSGRMATLRICQMRINSGSTMQKCMYIQQVAGNDADEIFLAEGLTLMMNR